MLFILLFRIINNPKDEFFCSLHQWDWNCLLWIIFCCCSPLWYSKAVRPYFSSTTVEGMKNKPWWSCWHECLFSHSIGISPPAADSSKMKTSIPGFTDTLNKICYKRKKKAETSLRPFCSSLIQHGCREGST